MKILILVFLFFIYRNTNGYNFDFKLTHFVDNSEYFGPFKQGKTLAGIKLIPKINLKVENFDCSIGLFYFQYWREPFQMDNLNLLLKTSYSINNFEFVFGNYEYNHHFLPIVFDIKKEKYNPIGLQLYFNNHVYIEEFSLNWIQKINKIKHIPEKILFNMYGKLPIYKFNNISIKFIHDLSLLHYGGQKIDFKSYNIFFGNIGPQFIYNINKDNVLKLKSYYVFDKYGKSNHKEIFKYGYGIYNQITLTNKKNNLIIRISHWLCNKFNVNDIGNDLYCSFYKYSRYLLSKYKKLLKQANKIFPKRNLLFFKIEYFFEYNIFCFNIFFEPYYDLGLNIIEHREGIYFSIDIKG